MTYYRQQIQQIRETHFPKQCVIDKLIVARHQIDSNSCEGLTINRLAAISLLSKHHFIRLFTQCYGTTPYQYLTAKRLGKAKELLAVAPSMADAAYCLGFETPSSFSAWFRKNGGLTPSAYQKKAILKKRVPPINANFVQH